MAMNGRKRTELEQSTRERENTSAKSATLYSPPLIVAVLSHRNTSKTDEMTPTKSRR